MCQQSMQKVVSSDDEEGEHNVLNLFLDVVSPNSSGVLVESSLEDERLARTALSCHYSMDLLCQEMQVAW